MSRRDAAAARALGTDAGRAAAAKATKDALAASALLARYSPREPERDGTITVTASDMAAAATLGRERLLTAVARVSAQRT